MRAWSGVKIDMLARWEAALCSEPDIYWINTVRDLHRWDGESAAQGNLDVEGD